MKPLLILLSLCISGIANATNYYFSNSIGDDSRTSLQAQNPATPWKSLTKLNTFFSTLVAGDSVLFKKGDTFYGSITVTKSGTNASNISFGAFGTGVKPIISGFTTVDTWTDLGGNIWESSNTVSTLSTCNIISIAGKNFAMGRQPKTGYWTIGSTNGNSITDASKLNAATTNWTGAQVVLRKYRWILEKFTIASASASTINFSNSGDAIQTGWGYFIQNDVRACTQQNDWAYNSTTRKLAIYSSSNPGNIDVPTIDQGITLNSKDYISINNLDFRGFNTTGINTTSRTGIKIQNCDFSFIGVNAIYGYPNSSGLKVVNNTFKEINSRAIHGGSSSNAFFSGNTLLNIGHYAGMGSNGDDSYTGIISNGDNAEVSYNSITNVGYCGIRWDGNAAVIKNNFVNTTNYIKDDGGGIYCYPNQNGPGPQSFTQRTVRDNIVINSIGAIEGGTPSSNASEAMGIYNDGTSPNVDYINNTIANARLGLFLNGAHESTISGNTIYNCSRGLYILNYQPSTGIANLTVNNNILASKDVGQYSAYFEPSGTNMPSSFSANNNVYARPLDDTRTIWQDVNGTNVYRTLAEWKTASGQDVNSQKSPMAVTTAYDLRFVYNETAVSKTISLGANYLDLKNIAYPGTITLAPYSSAVLIKNDATNVLPVADAGIDQVISLPTTVILPGTGIDHDGFISAYSWTKISGPVNGVITGGATNTASVTGMIAGIYKFELRVTDNRGGVGRDTILVNFGSIVVPVILVDFSAAAKSNKTTLLQWKTTSEINSDYFKVEKSADGRNFIQMGIVNAYGNSSTVKNYQMTDYFPEDGMNYYRLKMVDKDGQYQYSNIVNVNFKNVNTASVEIMSTGLYQNHIDIKISSSKEQTASFAIYDASGRMLFNSDIILQKGVNAVYKNMMLPNAVYYFKIVTSEEMLSVPMAKRN